jgi:UDP-4-amino-4,6-dideoxy-N-acetyl-beta-L-altrosamine N-acetyltransferase
MKITFKDITGVDPVTIEKARQWRNKKRIRKFFQNRNIIGKKEHHNWIKSLVHDKSKVAWIVYIDDVPVGAINLHKINVLNKSSEWGWNIGEDNYVGKGYGKKILHRFLDMFFNEMGFKTLITEVTVDNNIAISIYENFGFETAETKNGYIRMKYTKEQFKERRMM